MKSSTLLQKNGKMMKQCGKLFKRTQGGVKAAGCGLKMAADAGYKIGYNMGKYPQLEHVRDNVKKYYKPGIVALLGAAIGIGGIIGMLIKK